MYRYYRLYTIDWVHQQECVTKTTSMKTNSIIEDTIILPLPSQWLIGIWYSDERRSSEIITFHNVIDHIQVSSHLRHM